MPKSKQYFAKIISDHWRYKNNAQKEAYEVAHDMDRRLLSVKEIEDYKLEFRKRINEVNENNKRCHDLKLIFWVNNNEDEIYISEVFYMTLFLVKN